MAQNPSPGERNLLFGILALQNNLVDRAGLLDGFNRWIEEKTRPIGEILVERGALDAGECALLEALLAKHLEKFGGEPRKSLEAISSIGSFRDELSRIADPDIQASLAHVSAAPSDAHDPFGTISHQSAVGPDDTTSRFRILRFHARGGLGQVSVALDRELDRPVALKEIQDRHADDPASRARFVQEAEITGKLEHPGIVPVYGLGHDASGRPFYAMRFIKGDSLKEAAADFHADPVARRYTAERSARLRALLRRFTDVCNAVAYAHSRGVLHRDLKPGNIMLGPYGETLLVDWGLARPMGHGTTSEPVAGDASSLTEGPIRLSGLSGSRAETIAGTMVGTPAYASPEQVSGRLELLGPASDVYGLGATLYAVLTGRAPIEIAEVRAFLAKQAERDGEGPPGGPIDEAMVLAEVRRRAQRGDVPPARSVDPTIPKPLEAICRKAMALDPADRYPAARDLAREVERWLDDLPVSAYREPMRLRVGRWVRTHRTAAAAAFSAMVVALAGLGIMAWSRQRAERAEQLRAQELSLKILTVEIGSVRSLAENLGPIFSRVKATLADRWRGTDLAPDSRLKVALALGSSEPEAVDYLEDQVLKADPRTVRVIAEGLKSIDAETAVRQFWILVENPAIEMPRRFRAGCALAILDPSGTPADQKWPRHIDWVVREALNAASTSAEEIDRTLSPLEGLYLRATGRCCREGDPQRVAAYRLLRMHLERTGQQETFIAQARPAALILDADPGDFEWLIKSLESDPVKARESIARAAEDPDALFGDEPSMKGHGSAHRRARALMALARLGRTDDIWPALRSAPEPDLRTWLSRDLGAYGVDPTVLIARLRIEPDPGIRASLILALGGYDRKQINPKARLDAESLVLDLYKKDPDPGIHGAATWLLGARWEREQRLHETDAGIAKRDPSPTDRWFVNGQGQTFAVVRGPVRFTLGSASGEDEKGRVDNESPHEREIPRSFAIATTEVTVAQYRDFLKDVKEFIPEEPPFIRRVSPIGDCPSHGVRWAEAILYCRWLSQKEGIPGDQMCFPPLRELKSSLENGQVDLSPRRLALTGYRLPSEAEWEFACRAGSTTPRFFGRTTSMLSEFARFLDVSGALSAAEVELDGRTDVVGRLKPNDLGLFDVYGNVREWCLDAFKPYPTGKGLVSDTTFQDPAAVGDWIRVVRGGSFVDPAAWTRSAYRNGVTADQYMVSTGFRVARTVH